MAQKVQPQGLKSDGTLGTFRISDNNNLLVDFTPTSDDGLATEAKQDTIIANQTSGDQKTQVTSRPAIQSDYIESDPAGDSINIVDKCDGSLVDAMKPFVFANSDAQYTPKEVFVAGGSSIYPTRHKISVFNPNINTGVKVTVLNWNDDLNTYSYLTELSFPAGPARVDPTKVFYYDSSLESYTDLTTAFTDATANDVAIPGHAETEIGDILYIGYSLPFNRMYWNVGTARTDVADHSFIYSKTSTFGEITDVTDESVIGSENNFGAFRFACPSDWEKQTVNGENRYWIGIQCSGFTSAGTQGLITQGKIVPSQAVSATQTRDTFEKTIQFLNEERCKFIIQNMDAAIAASQTIAGAGGFTGELTVTRA